MDKFEEINIIKQSIDELSTEKKEYKNSDIKEMILYYGSMTNEIENRRSVVYEHTVTTINVIITACSLLVAILTFTSTWDKIFLIPSVFLLSLLITGILVTMKYHSQNKSDYIFKDKSLKDFSNTWKWFYYGNGPVTRININKNDQNSIEAFLDGYINFASKYKNETVESEIKDNLQQLYLLQVHNYYKNKFYLQLTKYQRIGSILSVVAVILFTAVYFIFIN